jgi:hypothetical protein
MLARQIQTKLTSSHKVRIATTKSNPSWQPYT